MPIVAVGANAEMALAILLEAALSFLDWACRRLASWG